MPVSRAASTGRLGGFLYETADAHPDQTYLAPAREPRETAASGRADHIEIVGRRSERLGVGVHFEVGVAQLYRDVAPAVALGAQLPGRHLRIGVKVHRQENRLRAQPPGGAQRHAGAHPETPRLVGRRRHPPGGTGIAVTADDYRAAAQLGAALDLDPGEERIHVEMQDAPRHGSLRLRSSELFSSEPAR